MMSKAPEIENSSQYTWTDMSLEELSPEIWPGLVEQVRDGNTRAAQILMSDASVLIQNNKPLPSPLREYIGEALYWASLGGDKVGREKGGMEATKAFGLKRSRGRNESNELLIRHLICMQVEKARRLLRKKTDAFSVLVEMYPERYSDENNVKDQWKKRIPHWKLDSISETDLEQRISEQSQMLGMPPTVPMETILEHYPTKLSKP